ncbi:MAG: pyrE, partial [Lacunisphaera sp.]|nr:pyrE [Lacunisphaera sp.]
RPGPVQPGVAGAGVEEDGRVAAGGDDIGVGHANAVGHAQRIHDERQRAELGLGIETLRERVQSDFVQVECPRQPAEFGLVQLGAIIQRILDARPVHLARPSQGFDGEGRVAGRLLQHVAEFVLQRRFVGRDLHGEKLIKYSLHAMPDYPSFFPMDAVQQEVTDIFLRTKALLQGHFVLRSGLHSGHFFQCAQVCQNMPAVERLGALLVRKLGALQFETVLAPAMGGLVIGQEVARQAKSRFIFAEKENNVLVMRRGFTLRPGEKVLVVEDVITRGGRVQECLEIVKQLGGTTVAVAVLVDRSAGQAKFDVPTYSLLEMSYPTYPADQVPEALAKIPASKPGS